MTGSASKLVLFPTQSCLAGAAVGRRTDRSALVCGCGLRTPSGSVDAT
jgi:hypothetical protein